MQRALLEHFGEPERILAARPNELRQVAGIGPKLAEAITAADTLDGAERQLALCRELGVDLLVEGTEAYPARLAEIFDPPPLLYARGRFEPRDELAVAIVGARRCTHYGRRMTERLAGGLARAGLTIVSGLARGLDAIAHRAALDAGGRTIAVLATGLANVYPPEHAGLADEIAKRGVVASESPLHQAAVPGLFPQRNRLVSGLSLGVIVVEASRSSGALHTARHAMEQGRSVLAVPGPIDSLASEGCHDLIRDGVILCRSADDVLEALGPLPQPVTTDGNADTPRQEVRDPRELTLTDQERMVLNLVDSDPRHVDEVLRGSALEPSRILATLTVLEMKRLVRRLPGGYLVRPH
jgi:DNA processing protein